MTSSLKCPRSKFEEEDDRAAGEKLTIGKRWVGLRVRVYIFTGKC